MADTGLPHSKFTAVIGTHPLPQTGDLRRSFTVLRRQADRLQRILEISQILTSTYDLNELLNLILQAATELTQTETASILLLNESSTELRFAASTERDKEKLASLRVPVDGSLAGVILRAGEPKVFDDVQQHPDHFNEVDKQLAFESRSMLGVPLILRDYAIGVLEALNKSENAPFTDEDGEVGRTAEAKERRSKTRAWSPRCKPHTSSSIASIGSRAILLRWLRTSCARRSV